MIKIKLRELMWDADVTAVKISEVTGISKTTISNIIRGKQKNVELDTIDVFCKFFKCKISDLLEFHDD